MIDQLVLDDDKFTRQPLQICVFQSPVPARLIPRSDLKTDHDTQNDNDKFYRNRDPVLFTQGLGDVGEDHVCSPDLPCWLRNMICQFNEQGTGNEAVRVPEDQVRRGRTPGLRRIAALINPTRRPTGRISVSVIGMRNHQLR